MKLLYYNPPALFFERRVAQLAFSQPPQLPQQVLGLQVAYPLRFRANTERARMVWATLLPEIASQLASLDVFDARGYGLITGIGVYRYLFRQGAPLTLDGVAEGSAEHLVCLDGVRNPKHAIRTLAVSGLDARWISFSADRWNGKVGVEELGIFDPGTQSLWTAQATYAKRPPLHPLSALALYRARASARKILGSIRIPAARSEKAGEKVQDAARDAGT